LVVKSRSTQFYFLFSVTQEHTVFSH
jgi:hypothetical protein